MLRGTHDVLLMVDGEGKATVTFGVGQGAVCFEGDSLKLQRFLLTAAARAIVEDRRLIDTMAPELEGIRVTVQGVLL